MATSDDNTGIGNETDSPLMEEELTKPIFKNGRFYNPWKGFVEKGFMDFVTSMPKLIRIPNPTINKKVSLLGQGQ